MAEIFNIRHEADLSEYTSTVTDSGDLSQAVAAALAGTSGGLQCVIDDTTQIYGRRDFTQFSAHNYRFRFYIDPNGLSMSDGDDIWVAGAFEGGAYRCRVKLTYDGANYEISIQLRDDGGSGHGSADYDITDEPHYIEVSVTQATNDSSSDATAALYVDGALQETVSGVDLFDLGYPDSARLGATAFGGTPTGTFYLDEFVLRDDNNEIGAVPVASTILVLEEAMLTGGLQPLGGGL